MKYFPLLTLLALAAGLSPLRAQEKPALELKPGDHIAIIGNGLADRQQHYGWLEAMIYKFNGGPVGLSSLAVAVGEDASTLEDVHEPFLIMQGYISRTPRGRVAMPSAYLKMGAAPPANGQGWLL